MGRPDIGGFFLNECVDIVEKGRINDVEISDIIIEGVYKEEIFQFKYTPVEEGYDEEVRAGAE
jgi:hypothetical protein